MIFLAVQAFLIMKEIERTADKITKLTYHVQRCTKASDRVKLSLMIAINAAKCVALHNQIERISRELDDCD